MPEGLQTPEGESVKLDAAEQEFNRAMAAPVTDYPAPPKKTPADAPYGLKADGTPKRGPGGRPAKDKHDKVRAVSGPVSQQASQGQDAVRAEGVKGLVQLGAGVCLLLDQRTEGDAYKADALTLANSADEISRAVVETARHNARFGALVDKVCSAGPYAALVQIAFSVGAQIARNHGVLAAEAMGAIPPERLLSQLDEDDSPNGAEA